MISDQSAPSDSQALRGKRLLVVLGSYRSKRHIYERARELGILLVILDGPRHWTESCAGPDDLVERHLSVDLAPFDTFVARSVEAVRGAGLALDGLGTIDGFAGGFASRIANVLGLPFHTVEATDLARDKHRAREAYAAAGLPGPRFARIEGRGDLQSAAEGVGFPAVLKPVTGVGSVQTFLVRDMHELQLRHAEIVARASEVRARASVGLTSDEAWFNLMWSGGASVLLESWVEGPKFDVDLLLDDGRVVYGHATDDLDPCGLRDVRRVAPSGLAPAEERELIDHAAACVLTLGFRRGMFNVEVKRTCEGPRLIEVNGRLGGYSTTDIHHEVWGIDLVEQWLRASLSLPLEVVETVPSCFVAESLLPSPRTGTLMRDGFLDHLAPSPQLLAARQWAFAGDVVAGVETGAPDWLGAVLTRGVTQGVALAELDRLVASIDFPVASGMETT
ncbi:MAG: ATP-grasp domain-containing protein [Vicinamibacteria bacterium]|nr:ATP-grasp domain-containing protein [Vicinamibacteria bacterium]